MRLIPPCSSVVGIRDEFRVHRSESGVLIRLGKRLFRRPPYVRSKRVADRRQTIQFLPEVGWRLETVHAQFPEFLFTFREDDGEGRLP
jgi:hypothetical protein